MVREIATAPLPRLEPCDERHWAVAMERLAILPRRADDARMAEVRDHAMQSLLAHYGNQAIIHMATVALRHLEWYPTPAQCIKILDAWGGHGVAGERKAKAQHLIRRERQARMDDTRKALQWGNLNANDINALPQWEKKVFETEGLIRENPEGGYTPRPRFTSLEK
jgi:hypothetical protein